MAYELTGSSFDLELTPNVVAWLKKMSHIFCDSFKNSVKDTNF